ncbi:hypothetical protein LY625_03820 [Lysobacter sp. GX 14042]|uniref:hypothetical protein n=1 Tax=Lysobacter sp. GX 14042 TaxID=2907155 RepID=UPI001F2D1A62|nr:hypothetical protein [Lysobacter sp. GX 14042]MCE7031752.1 hypothetical protein [Lysobacter sp. GX 14042]
MTGEVDQFGLYVAGRLEQWGREFALHRDCEYLGHQSKNMVQVLIEHKGEMPARPTGFKPLEVDMLAQQVEDIIADMGRVDRTLATVMRAYYCGKGRKFHERLETCNELLAAMGLPEVRREAYRVLHMRGFDWVRGVLIGMAIAA